MKKFQQTLLILLLTGQYHSAARLDNFPVAKNLPEECLHLYSTGYSPEGFILLEYQWIVPPPVTDTYGFTLFQWDNTVGWQSTSTKCDKIIQVLNVYPDIEESNTLAEWMHDPAVGLGRIVVTPVSISDFNSNPDRYLKDASGQYQYDAIMFGSWDGNNGRDLTPASAAAVRIFLNSGRGVLFGHDTQFFSNPNFSTLKDFTNLDIDPKNDRGSIWRGSTNIKVVNNGFLLKYPHFLTFESILTIPLAHTTGQYAKGVVWMDFPNTLGSPVRFSGNEVWHDGGTNNFYLTTWNNAAMIQTGHSDGKSTRDERNVIANTLWYLSQFTTEMSIKVCTAIDVAAPDVPEVNRKCTVIDIISRDNGSPNRFYVMATNMLDNTETCKSNELAMIYKSGLRGFYVLEDSNATSASDLSSNFTVFIPADENQRVSYNVNDLDNYIHIQAVDYFGNLSAVRHLSPPGQSVVLVSANPPEGGIVTGNDDFYCNDDTAIVTATPNEKYNFVNWTENGIEVSTDAVYSFIVTNDRTLVANFSPKIYDVTVLANPDRGGTVSGGGKDILHGTDITITAMVNEGWIFVNWTENGVEVTTSTVYDFTVTTNRTLVANFVPITYTVILLANPERGGTVSGGGAGIPHGTDLTVKAKFNENWVFVNWTENGAEVSGDADYPFIVTANRTLEANFLLDFDAYAVIICDKIILLNLKKLAEDGYDVIGCKWYKNGIEVTETNTNDAFSYAESDDKFLETEPTYYTYCLITSNYGVLCSTQKIILSRNKSFDFDCLECEIEESDKLLVYPNPASSGYLLTIEGVVTGSPVFIYNQLGVSVFNAIATGNVMIITLDLPPGIYLIRNENRIVKVLIVK